VKPEELTIEDLERVVGAPPQTWHGKCTALAHAAAELVSYHGFVSETGFWKKRRGFPNSHGWVLLDDGRILDPTRWSFEDVEPYIFLGESQRDYDEGGNELRKAFRGECPEPEGDLLDLKLNIVTAEIFTKLTGYPVEELTFGQIFWLANSPYDDLGVFVGPVYQGIIDNGKKALIPIDNRKRAEREGKLDVDPG
jgi:hypothetical protein